MRNHQNRTAIAIAKIISNHARHGTVITEERAIAEYFQNRDRSQNSPVRVLMQNGVPCDKTLTDDEVREIKRNSAFRRYKWRRNHYLTKDDVLGKPK